MATSSRASKDPSSHPTKTKTSATAAPSTRSKDHLSSVKQETATSSVSPSLTKRAHGGDRHREGEREGRSKDIATSDSKRRDISGSKHRESKDRSHEQDRQRHQQRQKEDLQAKSSSQPSKPPLAGASRHDSRVPPSTSSSMKAGGEKPHHRDSTQTRSHGSSTDVRGAKKPSEHARPPPERGGRDDRKVGAEKERKVDGREKEGRREREKIPNSKEGGSEKVKLDSKERERRSDRERKPDSREREERKERGHHENVQRTRHRDSHDQGTSSNSKKITVHEDPPVVTTTEAAAVGVAREGVGKGEGEDRLQPMMVVEDGYSYDEDFEVSQLDFACSPMHGYMLQV